MSGFASIGECMIELSGQEDNKWTMGFAGDTLNTAWYVRALTKDSYPVSFISAFGRDSFSWKQRIFLTSNGINIAQSPLIEGLHPGIYTIALQGAERTFTYWRSDSAARRLASDPDSLEKSLYGHDIIYFSGITLAIVLPEHRELLLNVLRNCRTRGARIAFDPNFRHQLWPNCQLAKEEITKALRIVDIAMPTFTDEQMLFGDRDAQACAERLISLGVREIVVKDGTNPALVVENKEKTLVPSVVSLASDTTGAGDSFNGAYLAARLANFPPKAAARKAHAVAARVVEVHGALAPMETVRDVFKGVRRQH